VSFLGSVGEVGSVRSFVRFGSVKGRFVPGVSSLRRFVRYVRLGSVG